MDLHKLANLPGAGNARTELRREGVWHETSEDGLPLWKVCVSFTATATVIVAAPTADAAKKAYGDADESAYIEGIMHIGGYSFESVAPHAFRDIPDVTVK